MAPTRRRHRQPQQHACVDEDECASNPSICGHNGTCSNVEGGFECACGRGFAPGPRGTCEDVDECRERSHLCAFRCHNTPGSFRCVCPRGYALAADGVHCADVDECRTEANNCRFDCKNLVGSYACVCPDGYKMVGDGDCADVDECAEAEDVTGELLCGHGGRCRNSKGLSISSRTII